MDCIVLAGGTLMEKDALATGRVGQPKTLIEVAGKPLVQWVLDALEDAPSVERVVVAGLGVEVALSATKLHACLPDQGGMLGNILAGIAWIREHSETPPRWILGCSGDTPLVTGEMLEWLIGKATEPDVDFYYTVVPQEQMLERFPTSQRSYVRFTDMIVAGGDVHIADPAVFDHHLSLWEDLIGQRKQVLKQARRLGAGFFASLLLHRLSTPDLERRVERKLGLRVRVLPAPYPELGMDVDKPEQLDLCRQLLKARTGA